MAMDSVVQRQNLQFRISEMKTAKPRIPSPFDTAGISYRPTDRVYA